MTSHITSDAARSIAIEEQLIGGVMAGGKLPAIVPKPGDFKTDETQKIWQAILTVDRSGDSICQPVVAQRIIDSGFDFCLDRFNDIISKYWDHSNRDFFARKIVSESKLSQLRAASEIIFRDEVEFRQAAERIEEVISRLSEGEWTGFRQIHSLAQSHAETLQHSGFGGLLSGFSALDLLLAGFRNGHVYIIGGRPANGKTQLALQIALNVSSMGTPVGYFLMETSGEYLASRAAGIYGNIPSENMQRGIVNGPNDWIKIGETIDKLAGVPLYVDASPDLSVMNLRSRMVRAKDDFGCGLFIVDYLQLVEARGASDREKVNAISAALRRFSKEVSAPIIALSQLSRKAQYERPTLHHFKESGNIEADADVAILVYRYHEVPTSFREDLDTIVSQAKLEGIFNPENGEEVIFCEVAKNRQGGKLGLVPYRFVRKYGKLYQI